MCGKSSKSAINKCRLHYSRLSVIGTSTGNLLQITEISNNWKSALQWPISNYYQFFIELMYKNKLELCNKMLHKSFPCKSFFKKSCIFDCFLFLKSAFQTSSIWDLVVVLFRSHCYQKETSIQVTVLRVQSLMTLCLSKISRSVIALISLVQTSCTNLKIYVYIIVNSKVSIY